MLRTTAPRDSGIYGIRNRLTGQIYIGSALKISKRWAIHRWQLARGTHHSFRLQEAWDAEACPDIFEFLVIEMVRPEQLVSAEQWWIDFYESYDPAYGYNIEPSADSSLGRACREQTREKISKANAGRRADEAERACRKAAMNTPEMREMFARIYRADDLRSRISLTKGGTGCVLTPEIIREAIAAYDAGDVSIKALCARYGVGYGAMQKALKGHGPKFGETKREIGSATAGFDSATVSRKIARTLRTVSDETAQEVRRLYAAGRFLQADLADRFGLSRAVVHAILKSRSGYEHLGASLSTMAYRGIANRKLVEADAAKIMVLRSFGATTESIAAQFGVSKSAISRFIALKRRRGEEVATIAPRHHSAERKAQIGASSKRTSVGPRPAARAVCDETAVEIRRLYATGLFSQSALAKKFQIDGVTAGRIVKSERGYRHLGEPLPTFVFRGHRMLEGVE